MFVSIPKYRELNQKFDAEVKVSFQKGAQIATIITGLGFLVLLIPTLLKAADLKLQCLLVGFIALYSMVFYFIILRSGIKGRNLYIPLIIPLLLPTVFLIAVSHFFPEIAFLQMTGPATYSYFIVIVISGFIFDFKVSAMMGLVSGAGYFLAYLISQPAFASMSSLDPNVYKMIVSPMIFIAKASMMLFVGLLVGGLGFVARRFVFRIFREEEEVNRITSAFGMIIDPRVRDLMISGKINLGGEIKENTVLFADIRGFTSFAQQMPPGQLFDFMKEYFDLMNQEIRSEDGTIIEYVGDEIMVLFGAPLPMENHAEKALRAALKMQRALARQNRIWEGEKKPFVKIGIGIHTGPVLVGTIGSSERYKYGALGDHVNLASRIQGLTKHYGVSILASEETIRQSKGVFNARELDCVTVRGRTTEVSIFDVLSAADEEIGALRHLCKKTYEEGLACYRKGDLDGALAAFRKCLEHDPGDRPSELFVERIVNQLSASA